MILGCSEISGVRPFLSMAARMVFPSLEDMVGYYFLGMVDIVWVGGW